MAENLEKKEQPKTQFTTSADGKPDPTGNVLQLVDAAVRRLDDLRAAETRRTDELCVLGAIAIALLIIGIGYFISAFIRARRLEKG